VGNIVTEGAQRTYMVLHLKGLAEIVILPALTTQRKCGKQLDKRRPKMLKPAIGAKKTYINSLQAPTVPYDLGAG
jgi:hypothetical protein